MNAQSRPLWKILLSLERHETEELTCAEWFTVLEYLAEAINVNKVRQSLLLQKARRHLTYCSDCDGYYRDKLAELEAMGAVEDRNS